MAVGEYLLGASCYPVANSEHLPDLPHHPVATALELASHLLKDGPKIVEGEAESAGDTASALYRLLRVLASVGVLVKATTASRPKTVSTVPLDRCLTSLLA
jgi:hypothetical protein